MQKDPLLGGGGAVSRGQGGKCVIFVDPLRQSSQGQYRRYYSDGGFMGSGIVMWRCLGND